MKALILSLLLLCVQSYHLLPHATRPLVVNRKINRNGGRARVAEIALSVSTDDHIVSPFDEEAGRAKEVGLFAHSVINGMICFFRQVINLKWH